MGLKSRYKFNLTREELAPYFARLEKVEGKFNSELAKIEKEMSEKFDIPEMEFFYCDNSIIGIGNVARTMRLVHRWG